MKVKDLVKMIKKYKDYDLIINDEKYKGHYSIDINCENKKIIIKEYSNVINCNT